MKKLIIETEAMLNSGDIVKGIVSRTEEWGLFLNYCGQEIFV